MTTLAQSLMTSAAIRDALATVVPGGEWPKDRKVRSAEQPGAIGDVLVQHVHKHLVNVSIGYLFRENMGERDRATLAKASKTSGPLEWYSRHAFLVQVNWTSWLTLSPEQKVALIDHELAHFGLEDTKNGTNYVMIAHDVEEFTAIVQRWGLWRPDLRKMSAAMAQRDLFEKPDEPQPSQES